MPNFKITVAYDGTEYVGWQRQAAGVSVQGLIESALRELDEADVTVFGAGRTDAGVHALAQVASFGLRRETTAEVVNRALNARLPQTVRVIAAEEAAAGFHARFSARAKTYRYRIWNSDVANPFERHYTWHIIDPLDVAAMSAAAQRLVGTHDFAAFQGTGGEAKTTTRTITHSAFVTPDSALIEYEIRGDGFLRHMVRSIVGTLVDIGRGRKPVDSMSEVLASGDRTRAGRTAPAAGLFLVRVDYGP
jgi:tRNA pseudouridine38-40 synthase